MGSSAFKNGQRGGWGGTGLTRPACWQRSWMPMNLTNCSIRVSSGTLFFAATGLAYLLLASVIILYRVEFVRCWDDALLVGWAGRST